MEFNQQHEGSQIVPSDYIRNKRRKYSKEELVSYLEREPGSRDFCDKEVLIHLDSFCIGDTICFSSFLRPFFECYKPKKILVTTFFKDLFDDIGEDIVFIAADSYANVQVDTQITVGYKREDYMHTINGLFYAAKDTFLLPQETLPGRPPVKYKERTVEKNKVTIAPESLKIIARWDVTNGWQDVVDYLRKESIDVYNVSYEDLVNLNEVINYNGFDDINVAIDHIVSSRFFIGLSSGLAWLAWAYEVPVVMIAGFTKEQNEFDCYRVNSKIGCSGCFNIFTEVKSSCPIFYGTPRENECHRLITPLMVIEKVKEALKDTE
jgi:autotransporter strand-loop-strand O-heptosyltransferase